MIKYTVVPNPLREGKHHIRTAHYGTINQQKIVKDIVERGSTLTDVDVNATLDIFPEVVLNEALRGNKIKLKMGVMYISLTGSFDNKDGVFGLENNELTIRFRFDKELTQRAKLEVETEKIPHHAALPALDDFTDDATKSVDDKVTVGKLGRITGEHLRYNADDPNQGVFFQKTDGTEVKVTDVSYNKSTSIGFINPEGLESGQEYNLFVRRSTVTNTKVHTGMLDTTLTIV